MNFKAWVLKIGFWIIISIILKTIWIFVIDIWFQKRIGYHDYGLFNEVFTISLLFSSILNLGIFQFSSINVSKEEDFLNHNFVPIIYYKIAASIIYFFIIIGYGFLNNFSNEKKLFLFFLGLIQFIISFIFFFRSILNGKLEVNKESFVSILDKLLLFILGIAIIIFNITSPTIFSFIFIQFLAYSVTLFFAYFYSKDFLIDIKWAINFDEIFRLISKSMPFAILAIITAFNAKYDVIQIKQLSNKGDYYNGVYASATRIVDGINMFYLMVGAYFLPILSKFENPSSTLKIRLRKFALIALLLIFAVNLLLVSYSESIYFLIYGIQNEYAYKVFAVSLMRIFPLFVINFSTLYLLYRGEIKYVTFVLFFCLIFSIILNLFLIPKHGSFGASFTSFLSSIFAMLLLFYRVIKVYKINNLSLLNIV